MVRNRTRRLRFEMLENRNLLSADISQLRYFDTWDGGIIRSTDPAGITYHAPSGRLLLVDSEIDEMSEYFVGHNIFEISTRGDTVYRQIASNNSEPAGITYNEYDGFFYVVNDDTRLIYRYDANLNVPLATVNTRIATSNATDPEDIASDPATGMLYVLDGKGGGRQVLVYNSNLVFQYRFPIGSLVQDGEGIAYSPITKSLFIVSAPDAAIFEFTTSGQFIRSHDLSEFVPLPIAPQGLTFGPTSDPDDSPSATSLYIVDGMVDNYADGRVFEALVTFHDGAIKSTESRISVGVDDAEEKASGSVSLTNSDLDLVYDGGNQTVGVRFLGINVPRGALIVDASLQFKVDESTSDATSLVIQGQATDNAPVFTTTLRDLSSRARTFAAVNWLPPPWPTLGVSGASQRSPNLASIIQQIVDRPGWLQGNSLALLIRGTGNRVAESYEGSRSGAPRLRIQYRLDIERTNEPPLVSAGSDQFVVLGNGLNLDGMVSDDGLPGPLTMTWSKVSGPGMVTFGNPGAEDTTASFSQVGMYVLRLSASDGPFTTTDDVTVQVTGQIFATRVGAGSDDAEEKAGGSVALTSSDLELVFDGSNQTVGLRFNGVNIPGNATILKSFIRFQVDAASTASTSLAIQGQSADNAVTFAAVSRDISSRPRTAARVTWTPPSWPTVGASGLDQRTPNIAAIIQEIVNRPGWIAGNSLAIVITGLGTRVAESYEGKSTAAPLLHVEYLVGGSASPSAGPGTLATTSLGSMNAPMAASQPTLVTASSTSSRATASGKNSAGAPTQTTHPQPDKVVLILSLANATTIKPKPDASVISYLGDSASALDPLAIDVLFSQLSRLDQ